MTSFTCIHTNGVYQQYKGNICNRAFKCGSELPEYVALILRNGGSQSPDRWLRELRNNQILDWLIGYGVREVISAGSCGALEKFPESTFLVPNKALRDEGTSYHYAPPSRFVEISEKARKAIEETILEHSMKYQEVITWSTDGFFRETKEKVAYRKSEGCAVVEMECSALAACADFRGATWGMILYTADSLADVDKYDERNWGGNAYEYALTLCLDAVIKL